MEQCAHVVRFRRMTNRNTRSGKLVFLLIALVVLAVLHPGPAKTQDIEQIRKAAEQGHASAQNNLGTRYSNGEGVPQDYQEAVKWYRKAAEQGHASAQFNLGVIYDNGEGVPQDYVQAHKWVNLAASRTTGEVAENSRILRDKLAEKMTASQIAEAQRLAREWQPNTWEQLKDK